SLDLGACVSIASRFRHLLPIGQQVLCMNPIVDELLIGIAFTLSNLIFMVGEDIINTTSMQIKALTKILHRHCRALDMPSRETEPPRTIPGHLTSRLSGLPERKIFWIV